MIRGPEVSIGMPVFNGAKHIRAAIKSLLEQSFHDFELIVSDNSSGDATESIVRDFMNRDPRVRLHCQASNLGAARNFGFVLDQARGRRFMWAAADDLWTQGWLGARVEECRRQPCLSYGAISQINEAGDTVSHPAHGRTPTFNGSARRRRWEFLAEDPRRGKANTIYGLYSDVRLARECFPTFLRFGAYAWADLMFLLEVLQRCPIICEDETRHLKRIPPSRVSASVSTFPALSPMQWLPHPAVMVPPALSVRERLCIPVLLGLGLAQGARALVRRCSR